MQKYRLENGEIKEAYYDAPDLYYSVEDVDEILAEREDRVSELEHALSQVKTLAERDSETFGKSRFDIAARAKESL